MKLDSAQLTRELDEARERFARLSAAVAELRPYRGGSTPREAIWRSGTAALYHYPASAGAGEAPPLLVIYSLVNRPDILDFTPQRSVLASLRDAGHSVYLLDWGRPGPGDRHLSLDDYVDGLLYDAIEQIRQRHAGAAVSLFGVCQGGTLALCYAALYPEHVAKLVTLVTPVDFHAGNASLYHLAKYVDFDRFAAAYGTIPASVLNIAYVGLKPFRILSQRYVDMLDIAADPAALTDFMRMEQWMYDSPDQAGEAFRQFAKHFYQNNDLIHGRVRLAGRPVRLDRLDMPVLNVYAADDHLVPAPSALALGDHVPKRRYQAVEFPGGHLAVFVTRRAHTQLYPMVGQWLRGTKDT
ncbi:MAG TPA: class III poly(R)-hydroxyalkanoic acid synthase subunit PhaC [Gammaproteobacteria bacterium]|nr:class III poly(R)-hydroxyalkanoic acid synthase subunit PhaC [Gammaproteobacteria bacterium]